jgi:hypothetical protein
VRLPGIRFAILISHKEVSNTSRNLGGKMYLAKFTQVATLVAIMTLMAPLAHADLGNGDPSLSNNLGLQMDQLQQSTDEAQADIAAQQKRCDESGSSEVCEEAKNRIAGDVAQIQSNKAQGQQLGQIFNRVSTKEAVDKRQKVAGLKDCLYAAAVACSLLSGGGDLTQTSLSGKSIRDEITLPTFNPASVAGSR